jgi:hypothetical protein
MLPHTTTSPLLVVILLGIVSNQLDVSHGFAIQQPARSKNNYRHNVGSIRTTTSYLQATSEAQEFETVSSLEAKLSALLQEAIDAHDLESDVDYDDDAEESLVELEKLSILYTRRDNLTLNRTYVDTSAIAGRGLFALCDAKKGDLLTCYPGDALVIVPDDDEDDEFEDEYEDQPNRGARLKKEKQKRKQQKKKKKQDDSDDWTIVWGEHVTMAQEEVEAELQANLRAFTLHAGVGDNNVGIFALPSMDDNPAYLGHFVNDGATKIPMSTKGLSSYMLESSDTANAVHQDILGGVHMVTLAKRDIKKGEEIFVTYGPEYWMEQPDFGNAQDEDMDADINEMSNGKGFGS